MPQLTAALPRAPLLAHRPVRVLSHPAELADSWDQLAIGSGSPMHHYAWVSACAELFSKPGDVHLVVLGSPEDPAAIAPLVRAHGPVPRLELLGLRHLHEPTDFVYRDAGAAAALAAAVAPLGLPLFLERVPAESDTVSALKTAWRGPGVLRLCYLRIGERTAAVQFAVEAEGRFWLLKIGYDPAFARCSPGQLLLWETVRYAARRGLRTYEFLGGPEPWIRVWTERIRPCVAVRAYPARPLGMAALAIDVATSGWGRVRRSVGQSS